MCGIAGYIDKRGIDLTLLEKMTSVLTHRGPDDHGIWTAPGAAVGFGHRRLSILDLSSSGRQPMVDRTQQVAVVFNGEIYNYRLLRAELELKGHRFVSTSDTEVLMKAYSEWGLTCLNRLEGMFAFALHDAQQNRLVLARDRSGEKPLYYAFYGGRLAFASELKAILQDPSFSRDLDPQALNHYFALGYIPGERTIYKDAKKLRAGSSLVVDLGSMASRHDTYWRLPDYQPEEPATTKQVTAEFERLFEDAVKLRQAADVPLGVLLSGGIDSSLVVALMARTTTGPIRTFSIGFAEQDHDERPHSRLVARHFGTEHSEHVVNVQDLDVLEDLSSAFDEPFADPSLLPTYYLMRMTRQHVTVALSGDGGDELFGGYDAYRHTLADEHLASYLPRLVRQTVVAGGALLPEWMPGKQRLRRQLMTPQQSFVDRRMAGYFRLDDRLHLLSPSMLGLLNDDVAAPELTALTGMARHDADTLQMMTRYDFHNYLSDDILVKVDRTSMWASLEVRAPFLDSRLIDFAFRRLPSEYKVRGGVQKFLPKELARQLLPPEFAVHRKQGFAAPLKRWFAGKPGAVWLERLREQKHEWLRSECVNRLIIEHREGKADHGNRLFSMIMFMLWAQRWKV